MIGAVVLGLGASRQGIAHYRGQTTWLLRYTPTDAMFFTPLWVGPILLLGALADVAEYVSRILALVLAIPAMLLIPAALLFMVWLPARVLPAWYLRWRSGGRRFSDLPGRSVPPGQELPRS